MRGAYRAASGGVARAAPVPTAKVRMLTADKRGVTRTSVHSSPAGALLGGVRRAGGARFRRLGLAAARAGPRCCSASPSSATRSGWTPRASDLGLVPGPRARHGAARPGPRRRDRRRCRWSSTPSGAARRGASAGQLSTYAVLPARRRLALRGCSAAALLDGTTSSYVLARLRRFPGDEHAELPADRARRRGRRRPVARLTSLATLYMPVLPVEVAAGLLTAGVASPTSDDLAVIGLLAVVGLLFQYLLRTALLSKERAEQLEARTRSSPRCRSACSAPCSRRSRCATG